MAARELLVVILNHTNKEHNIKAESPSLDHGHWIDTPDSRPPREILAGESGRLRCQSSHIYGVITGSVSRVFGFETNNKVTLSWNIPCVGPNKYDCCCPRDAFNIRVLCGRGNQAVVVFVFGKLTIFGNDPVHRKSDSHYRTSLRLRCRIG
ncbi:hypothetical protein NOF04DRAFT_1195980 [Fusarium oxysporum II5]|uniref:Uncharacterized protein n=1 Tax=Fusarium oxysporum f. sp. cubense TaxID=61366 RepID=A0A5C6TA64_FUSOC|nr:hypothetical protein NOF04DRAFT_1195980 [Fusarium oxysporum II5]TXC07677.1 hypothetical protein FocTR4_00004334 [Fusarium oxysporum f. sp. cubense]